MAQFRRNACRPIQRLSQTTVLALMGSSINDPVPDNPLNPAAARFKNTFFLRNVPLNHWEIVSFNPQLREVCVRLYVYNELGERTGDYRVISITLPYVAHHPNR